MYRRYLSPRATRSRGLIALLSVVTMLAVQHLLPGRAEAVTTNLLLNCSVQPPGSGTWVLSPDDNNPTVTRCHDAITWELDADCQNHFTGTIRISFGQNGPNIPLNWGSQSPAWDVGLAAGVHNYEVQKRPGGRWIKVGTGQITVVNPPVGIERSLPDGYYLQLFVGPAPLSGQQVCFDPSLCGGETCNGVAEASFATVYANVVVDCHKGQGFLGAYYGLAVPPTLVHTGAAPATGFLAAPQSPPSDCGVTSTVGCQPCCTVVQTHSLLNVAGPTPMSLSIVPNANPGIAGIAVVTCDLRQVLAQCGGMGTFNAVPGTGVPCQCAGPTGTEHRTWGSLKTLFE